MYLYLLIYLFVYLFVYLFLFIDLMLTSNQHARDVRNYLLAAKSRAVPHPAARVAYHARKGARQAFGQVLREPFRKALRSPNFL